MAEAKKNYANIEKIGSLLGAEGIGSLLKNVQSTEKKLGDILRKLRRRGDHVRRSPKHNNRNITSGLSRCRTCKLYEKEQAHIYNRP